MSDETNPQRADSVRVVEANPRGRHKKKIQIKCDMIIKGKVSQ